MASPAKLFVLKPSTPKLIINKFKNLDDKDQSIINSKQISLPVSQLHSSATRQFFGPQTFQHIHSWHLSELCCFKKLYPQILLDLSHINFNFLLRLNLSKCYIQSIQSIAWLNSPSIEQIRLDDNDIKSIKPLAKLNLKHLSILSISNNFFEHDQLSYLTRVKLQSDKVVHLKASKSFKKRTNCIETVFKIQAGKKINASIVFTQINNKVQMEKLQDVFPNSITSMTENQFWMLDQLQMEIIKQTPQRNQVQSHSYFQQLNI